MRQYQLIVGGALELDPFCGTGTTGVVALRYQRKFIGIELNPEFAGQAERRIRGDSPLFNVSESMDAQDSSRTDTCTLSESATDLLGAE